MRVKVSVISSISGMRSAIVEECMNRSSLREKLLSQTLSVTDDPTLADESDIVVADPGLVAPIVNTRLQNMKWLQSTFAGVNLLLESSLRRDYTLCRIGRGFGEQMAEYVLGWILALQLRVPDTIRNQCDKKWNTEPYMSRGLLRNKTLGILGAGQIGTEIARTARAFGLIPMGLVKSDRGEGEKAKDMGFLQLSSSLEEVLAMSDIVVNCLPSTPCTRNLLTLPLLQSTCCGRRPLFINIGRGDVITTDTILAAIEQQAFSHCVLDVAEVEPLPVDSPLWTHPSVTITPHISALSYPEQVAEILADNLERYVSWRDSNGQSSSLDASLLYAVDWEKGY